MSTVKPSYRNYVIGILLVSAILCLRWHVPIFSRGESIARAYPTPLLYVRDTENKYGGARLFLCKF